MFATSVSAPLTLLQEPLDRIRNVYAEAWEKVSEKDRKKLFSIGLTKPMDAYANDQRFLYLAIHADDPAVIDAYSNFKDELTRLLIQKACVDK